MITFRIPEPNIAALEIKLEKLQRRAAKLGLQPLQYSKDFYGICDLCATVEGEFRWLLPTEITEEFQVTATREIPVYTVTVQGESPKLAGWELLAVLEPLYTDAGAENIIRTVPGKNCPASEATRVGACDHCKQNRRRSETFVVQHEDGSIKCVGRSCLKDFLGNAKPEHLLNAAMFLFDLEGACKEASEFSGGGYQAKGAMLIKLLAVTAAAIERQGWLSVSRAEFGGTATRDYVSLVLLPNPYIKNRELLRIVEEIGYYAEQDAARFEAEAEAVIEWARNITPQDAEASSYLANCRTVAKCSYVPSKLFGVACSMVAAYQREQDRLREQERVRKQAANSAYVGTVGRREEFEVECIWVKSLEGSYGVTGLHKLQDPAGNVIMWFASSSAGWLAVGERYKIKATVVKQDEYQPRTGNPIKQTTVNRVKILDEILEN